MPKNIQVKPRKFTVFTEKNLEKIPQLGLGHWALH